MDDIAAIEEAFWVHWSNFGLGPGGTFHDDGDLLWIEAPVPQLPYNVVLRTRLGPDAAARIREVTQHFRRRDVQFMWLAHPSAQPRDLPHLLQREGLTLVEHGIGMVVDERTWREQREAVFGGERDRDVVYAEVADEEGMRSYEELIAYYWELPEASRQWVYGINRWAGYGDRSDAVRWVASLDGRPVGKAFLSLKVPTLGAIFGVSVREEARGRGIAGALTGRLVDRAFELGRSRVVLHSSEMAHGLYRRMGFADRCDIPVYATTSLHTLQSS